VEQQLAAIMAVSRAVSEGEALETTMATISRTAASLAGAAAAAIILRRDETAAAGLSVVGSYGLSDQYTNEINRRCPLEVGSGPSGLATERGEPIAVADVLIDPIFSPWRDLAIRERYRAMVSVPLRLGRRRRVIGVLSAYRRTPGEWSEDAIDLMLTLADHAAIAIQTARLLEESRQQIRGLSLVVRSLRTQGHEHSNLVHAVYGLIVIGEVEEALALISGTDARYNDAFAAVAEAIENSVISGFLVAESVIAGNSGIELKVVSGSRLRALPPAVSELDAVTILGNLIHNATEAVGEMPASRRRISVRLSDRLGELKIQVRDWGQGITAENSERVFRSGYSTKNEHVGIGLAMTSGIVNRAGGQISIDRPRGPGVTFTVRIPFA
jgi:signal transduction histidine kinase